MSDEERIGLFLDYENLAIGTRDQLDGLQFDLQPISDALAARGRVVVKRAYADWNMFEADRRMLVRHNVELIEIPQKMGAVRKNAADIKMAVDAMEMAFERVYITTFVICTGDSDFTPLVHKLRELNKRVIGVGVQASTSALLPPACDEFLFYERLDGVDVPGKKQARKTVIDAEVNAPSPPPEDVGELEKLVTGVLVGLQRSADGPVRSSSLKRAVLRKDPTFNEAAYGFRAFGEVLRYLSSHNVVTLDLTESPGDPFVEISQQSSEEAAAFELLVTVVKEQAAKSGPALLSGLKNKLRKKNDSFSEKKYGFSGFLQFVKAAQTKGLIDLRWDDSNDDYVLAVLED